MKDAETVSLQEMKDSLARNTSSRFPCKITLANGDVIVRYIRGFADHKSNIVLISENAHTLALRILEVKEIRQLEFGRENSDGQWKVLQAKWR